MKNIVKLNFILFLLVFILSFTTKSYATASGTLELETNKTEYKKGEEIVVNVKISNFESTRGINAIGGYLEYDKENLTYKEMKGKNGWSAPAINSENGKFISTHSSLDTTCDLIFEIIFEAKTDEASDVNIKLNNIQISDGNGEYDLNNATALIEIVSSSIPLNPDDSDGPNKDDDNNDDNNNDDNNNGNNNNGNNNNDDKNNANGNNGNGNNANDNKDDGNKNGNNSNGSGSDKNNNQSSNIVGDDKNQESDNLANKILPHTGSGKNILAIIIVIAIISIVIFFRKYKIFDKIIKNK